ncbi:hypothetical protein BT93_J2049 [Corymbia citriodora subsp. variegata]|nr:hypothetical protein BT93_J2049 [Corymbia citriodora subsp. variegata]
MAQINSASPKPLATDPNQPLRDKKVKDIVINARRLVEVPYTASLAHTMNALVANSVVAVPVAAPPGQWIGAGGSMIMEADKQTGTIRKHYIGMVTMLDILTHIAGDDQVNGGGTGDASSDLDQKMTVPVSNIIGHCLEGLSLWTLNPNTSILDCMEVLSKGIHRALVPLDSHMDNISGVELVESASSYRMLTQMDVLRFLKEQKSGIATILLQSVEELGAINRNVFAMTDRTRVIEAIKCMRAALLNAVPIVASGALEGEDDSQLVDGRGRKLIGTFSATDLRRCHVSALRPWLSATVLEFTESTSPSPLYSASREGVPSRELVTCRDDTPLAEVMDKAVNKHVHRVWVVDHQGSLAGLVSLTDMIRVLRAALLSA